MPRAAKPPPEKPDNATAGASRRSTSKTFSPGPTRITSGKVPEAPDESWTTIDNALRHGKRGLPSGLALGKVWAKYRGARNRHSVPRLTERQILAWAEAWRQRHGKWPIVRSGDIPEAPGDNWVNMDNALRMGLRGLPGGSSLKQLLKRAQDSGFRGRRRGQKPEVGGQRGNAKRKLAPRNDSFVLP